MDHSNSSQNQALKNFDFLVGNWEIRGPVVSGTVSFKWLEGGYFLVQEVDMEYEHRKVKGIEYIGFDDSRYICTSHFFDNSGHLFTYDWELIENEIIIWFGRKGSDNRFKGRLHDNRNSYSGAWAWPGGGYEVTLTRYN